MFRCTAIAMYRYSAPNHVTSYSPMYTHAPAILEGMQDWGSQCLRPSSGADLCSVISYKEISFQTSTLY